MQMQTVNQKYVFTPLTGGVYAKTNVLPRCVASASISVLLSCWFVFLRPRPPDSIRLDESSRLDVWQLISETNVNL